MAADAQTIPLQRPGIQRTINQIGLESQERVIQIDQGGVLLKTLILSHFDQFYFSSCSYKPSSHNILAKLSSWLSDQLHKFKFWRWNTQSWRGY